MRILVTRPTRPAARTAARLRAAGYEVISDPLLELEFTPPGALLAEEADGVIFTSSNGVRAIARHTQLPALLPLKIWTVGSRTTAAARELGFGAPEHEALDLRGLGSHLAALPAPPLKLVHFAGADRAGDLAALIAASDHRIETVVVYKAHQAAAFAENTISALRQGSLDVVLHYSRRTAESYLALLRAGGLDLAARPRHICLSEAVAEPLRNAGGVVRVATLPTEDALLACLEPANPPRQAEGGALDTSEASIARTSMADPENPRSETEGTAKRSMKPRSAVLDLKAKEVSPAPPEPLEVATPGIDTPPSESGNHVNIPSPDAAASSAGSDVGQTTAASETASDTAAADPDLPRSPKDPVLSDSEPRSSLGALVGAGLAGAVIAIVIFLVLVSAELIPLGGAANPALGSRVAGVETELQALSQRVEATSSTEPPTDGRLQELAASVQSLREQVEAQAAAPPASEPAADNSAALATLEQRIAELTTRVNESPAPAADPEAGEAVARLSSRIDEIAASVAAAREPDPAVAQATDQAGRAAEQASRAVEQARQAADGASKAGADAGKAAEDAGRALNAANRASVLASAASLESAIARGVPYRGALSNLRDHLPGATVEKLEAGADKGLPTLELLATRLKDTLDAAPRPEPTADNLVDRFVEGARNMVRVRPAEGSAQEIKGDDSWAVRNRLVSKLDRRAYADALAEWDNLDAGAKKASEAEAEALRSRLGVDQALDAVREQALAGTEAQP